MVKDYLGNEKTSRKEFRQEYVGDVLDKSAKGKESRRSRMTEKRESRQMNRSERKEARFVRKESRKGKRNAKKLALIKTQRGERYFFPLSRIRLGKKKYKDGTTAEVKALEEGLTPRELVDKYFKIHKSIYKCMPCL
jgi:hypothetical protein